MSTLFGGGSGSSDTSTTPNMDDASLGDAITGGDGSFGATGGSDLGTMLSSIGQAFAGGGQSNVTNSPAATVQAITQATDPTGSIGAQTAITGGQGAPQQNQNQNPQGPTDNPSDTTQDQFAPTSAVDQLRKALTGLRQQQRQNPYSFPANSPQSNADAGQNSPMLNRAGRIPTDQTNQNPNAPSQDASNMEFMNDNTAPPAGVDPAAATQAGLRTNAPDTSGQFKIPGSANQNNPPKTGLPATQPGVPATQGGGGGIVPSGGGGALAAPATEPAADGSGGLGGLAALARMMGIGGAPAAGAGFLLPFMSTPAETGEMPQQTLGRSPSGPTPPALGGGPGNEEEAPTGAVTTAPATGKPIKTVDPKTGKPVDPKTGAPLPTKKEVEPAIRTGQDEDAGPIMRDISGVNHGNPMMLGQLAKMAMPLLMAAMSGGFGGGRRGGHWHGGRGFHPGGRGMWPYHHPTFGWGMHGFHPGGGWRPMNPVHFRNMGPTGGGGGGMNPQIMSALLGGGGGNQQSQAGGGRGGQSGGGGASGNWGYQDPQTQGPWSANPFLNTVVGAESSGQNSGAPGGGPGGDGGIARGFYNIQTPTWSDFAAKVPGASQYKTADAAPPEVQTAVAMTIPAFRFGGRTRAILHQKFGDFDERMTLGQLADQFGGAAWANRGKTSTGGSKSPNPDGNDTPAPATTQQGPESMVVAAG